MTKSEYLNIASDLRRSANWIARDQKEKLPLIKTVFKNAYKYQDVCAILKHFKVGQNPDSIFDNREKRIFAAEQLLISSLRLQNLNN